MVRQSGNDGALPRLVSVDGKVDRYTGINDAGVTGNFAGTRLPNSPKWQFSFNPDYTFPLLAQASVFMGGSVIYKSDTIVVTGGDVNPASSLPADIVQSRIKGYTVVDPRAGLMLDGGRWRLGIYGKNVFHEYYWTSVHNHCDVAARGMTVRAPLLAVSLSSASWPSFLLWVIVPIALVNMIVAPAMVLTQELAPAQQRATAAALPTTVMNLVGIGVGPVLVGSVSEWFKSTAGLERLRHAMLITLTSLCLTCAFCLNMASRHLRCDLPRRSYKPASDRGVFGPSRSDLGRAERA